VRGWHVGPFDHAFAIHSSEHWLDEPLRDHGFRDPEKSRHVRADDVVAPRPELLGRVPATSMDALHDLREPLLDARVSLSSLLGVT